MPLAALHFCLSSTVLQNISGSYHIQTPVMPSSKPLKLHIINEMAAFSFMRF
jgi:hypothetical protein